jgi:hypothetical protein
MDYEAEKPMNINTWLTSIGIPIDAIESVSTVLQNNFYKNKKDIESDPPKSIEQLERMRIPGRLANRIWDHLPKKPQVVEMAPLRETDVWDYTVYVTIEGVESCTGVFIQSATNLNHKHLLLNLHSFQDDQVKHKPVIGFPRGFESEFYILAGKELPKKKTKTEEGDPLKMRIYRLVIGIEAGVKTEKLDCIHTTVLVKDYIIDCSGERDALVLFDMPFRDTTVAPVSSEVARMEKVHIFGFAVLDENTGVQSVVVGGEIMAVSGAKINLSCPSSPGLSGGAIVRDYLGGVIGYLGGGFSASDRTFFGSYAFSLYPEFEFVQRKDKMKLLQSQLQLKDTDEVE